MAASCAGMCKRRVAELTKQRRFVQNVNECIPNICKYMRREILKCLLFVSRLEILSSYATDKIWDECLRKLSFYTVFLEIWLFGYITERALTEHKG